MFLINFIPDWLVHAAVLAGALLIFSSFVLYSIPFVNQYRLPFLFTGLVVCCIGFFIEGVLFSNGWWEAKVKELEIKVAAAQAKVAVANVKIITKYVDKVRIVKETADANVKYIETYITKHDNDIDFPKSFIMLHDSASQNEVSGSPGTADETPSEVKASELLTTVVENYGTCNELRETVIAWQEWYKTQKEIFEGTFK
jgi:hypothetical protein